MMDIKSRVEDIIEIYNKTETELNYKRRSENESSNIKTVLKAIQDNKFRLRSTQSKEDFISILKAADNISLDIGTNYLEQFLKLPDVQNVINDKFHPYYLVSLKNKVLRNKRLGDLPSFDKTVSEMDKNAANRYLSLVEQKKGITAEKEMNNIEKYIKAKIETGADLFSLKTNANTLEEIPKEQNLQLRFARVMIRQQGKNPGEFKIENGMVQFEIDVPDKDPIFHGYRQEQGIANVKQEEVKNEEKNKTEKESMWEFDEEFYKSPKFGDSKMIDSKKREDMYKENKTKNIQADKFRNALKAHKEDIHRINNLPRYNSSKGNKQNKGMGMER